jgi:hypothetical protein
LCVIYLFSQEELKRAASLGVFGVADSEFDIHLPNGLGVRTRKVEKSVRFSLSLKIGYLGVFGVADHEFDIRLPNGLGFEPEKSKSLKIFM